MENIDSFFNFLQKHIENGGYNEMLKMYTGDNLTKVSFNNVGEIIGEEGFYLDPNALAILSQFTSEDVIINKETLYLKDVSYINPTNLSIRVETYDSQNTLIDESVKYFYDDITKLYKSQFGMLKKCFANSLMKDMTDVNRNSFNEGMLLKLNYFLELSDSKDYIVHSQDGTPKNLLQAFLQDSISWVQKQRTGGLPQQKDVEEIPDIDFNDAVNNFNGMPLDRVRSHFQELTIIKSKNGKPHLTEEQLSRFIKKVFIEGVTLSDSKIEFNINRGDKQAILRVFYDFYTKSISSIQYEGTMLRKEKYVKLLTDNFMNFDYKKVSNNFNKYK